MFGRYDSFIAVNAFGGVAWGSSAFKFPYGSTANLELGTALGYDYPSDVSGLLVRDAVQDLVSCHTGWAALVADTVVTVGEYLRADQGTAPGFGAYPQDVRPLLQHVSSLHAYNSRVYPGRAVAAVTSAGQVVVFGSGDAADLFKGSSPATTEFPSAVNYPGDVRQRVAGGIASVVPNRYSCAALKNDGSVVAWGSENYGGDLAYPVDVRTLLSSNVVTLFASSYAFAALLQDGRVVSWGNDFGVSGSLLTTGSAYGFMPFPSDVSTAVASGVTGVFSNPWSFVSVA